MTAVITERETPVSTGVLGQAPAEREASRPVSQTRMIPAESLITEGYDWRVRLRAAGAYFTPPSVLTDRPASVKELSAYAHRAGWTAQPHGPLRALGIGWHRAIGLPATVVCRYAEWIAQRPGRALPVFALWKLLILTGPGPWIAENVITPAAHVAAWVLL